MTTTKIVLYNATILLGIGVLLTLFYFGFLYLAEIAFTENLLKVHPSEKKVAKWILSVQGTYDSRYNDGRHIVSVSLHKSDITNEDIKQLSHLKKLRELILGNPRITDEVIPYINNILSVEILDLRGSQITSDGLQQLKLPKLRYIECEGLMDAFAYPSYDKSNLPALFGTRHCSETLNNE